MGCVGPPQKESPSRLVNYTMQDAIAQARKIAERDLRACYREQGVVAGLHHFDDYWARDSFFSAEGALLLKDSAVVKKNLTLFLKHAREDGELPLRIGVGTIPLVLRMQGIRLPLPKRAIYHQDKGQNPAMDQNSLLIIAVRQYLEATGDKSFVKRNFDKLKTVVNWNFRNDRDEDFLIEEGEYATWMDSIRKRGTSLYTNVCHWQACSSFAELSRKVGSRYEQRKYSHLSDIIYDNINFAFWRGSYYADFTDRHREDYFSVDGNLLAIIWGLATKKQTERILDCIQRNAKDNILPPVWPEYEERLVSPVLRLVGMGDYHVKMRWLFLSCWYARALLKAGRKSKAKQVIEEVASLIVKYGKVFEVYTAELKPVKRVAYSSDVPFAWSASAFVKADKALKHQ